MSQSSVELNRLLAGEIARRLPALFEGTTPLADARAALHSLKGSAAMAGHPEFALVIGQLSAKLRELGESALPEARELLEAALKRLELGHPPLPGHWPEPPPTLVPSQVEKRYHAEYQSAMRDRLGQLDAVLAETEDPIAGLEHAQRTVHAMKGAAAAVGDEVTAWYCHGLEAQLRSVPRADSGARDAIVELARHRALLALLLEDQKRAIETLRVLAGQRPSPLPPPPRPSRRSRPPGAESEPSATETPLKIADSTIDSFFERLERVSQVEGELAAGAEVARQMAQRLRAARGGLLEALRQIGPARPWGPPAGALARIEALAQALLASAGNAERGAQRFRRNADFLHARTSEMRAALSDLRRTPMSWLFERIAYAGKRFAESEGKRVRVELVGADVPIDRRLAERLFDVTMQLVRNAVAHGIERPERRAALGKTLDGQITLRAERIGEWLRVVVEDDGQGADVERVRELAVERGIFSADLAARSTENDLLALLFLPGLTTSARADLLAGRGLGLDLVQDTVRRLGGTIRLQSRTGGGLSATVQVPSDQRMFDVLWVEEQGYEFALPVNFTGKVGAARKDAPPVRLSACMGQRATQPAPIELEIVVYGVDPVRIGVDAVGDIEETGIRAIPPLIADAGPFSGAILRGDGSLKLVLDAPLIAARAWAKSH